tara:strand:- start:196 stop:588 length:393 start_codon:yes stop_codon:yes gene_type:complete
MKNNVITALKSLRPNSQWTIYGDLDTIDSYDSIEWGSSNSTSAPSKAEIQAELTRLDNAEPMKLLRDQRNTLLNESDWTRLDDNGLSSDKKAEWSTYRQALRDLPSSADPKLDEIYELIQSSVTWPSKPS